MLSYYAEETEKRITTQVLSRTHDLVMANLLCFPEESRYTFAFTTLRPRFLSAFICTQFKINLLYDNSHKPKRVTSRKKKDN